LLMANGFRRSGDTIYKPHCERCHACQPIAYRYLISYYLEVKRRLLSKAKNLRWEMKTEMDAEWFELYSSYICKRHKNGTMYPPK
ncbi:arginyltransferase, partial [Vibrio parahaemolyticus]|nr:arginyltransferase [Vibrio parahaemolyticus]